MGLWGLETSEPPAPLKTKAHVLDHIVILAKTSIRELNFSERVGFFASHGFVFQR